MKTLIIALSILAFITAGCQRCDITGTWLNVSSKDALNDSIKLVFSKDNTLHYHAHNTEVTKAMNDAGEQYDSKLFYRIISTEGTVKKGIIYSEGDSTKQYFNYSFTDCNKMTMKIENPYYKSESEFVRIE